MPATILLVINSHLFNKLMIWSTKYGREVFWPIVIILLFVFGGWTGRKTAVVIAISMLVLIPLGGLAKDIIAKSQASSPKGRLLDSSRQRLKVLFATACLSYDILRRYFPIKDGNIVSEIL